jgi:hypothetical protein
MGFREKLSKCSDEIEFVGVAVMRGVASLPDHPVMLALIVLVAAAPELMTSAQLEYLDSIKEPLINGATIAALYWVAVSAARSTVFRGKRMTGAVGLGVVMRGATHGVPVISERKPLSESEFHRVAIHEAGHLLALALFPDKPVSVRAYARGYHSSPTGHVQYEFSAPIDVSYSWAHMLNTLAGQVAEKVINGSTLQGSERDNTAWETLAKQHLRAGFAPERPWFITPEAEGEARVNARTLEDMRAEQVQQLTAFFMANRAPLEKTAYRLKEVDVLETAESLQMLEAVAVPT